MCKVIFVFLGILYTTYIGSSASLQGCAPLFFELICETAFPIAEGLTNGIQTWMNNLVGLIFLLLFLIPAIGQCSGKSIYVSEIIFSIISFEICLTLLHKITMVCYDKCRMSGLIWIILTETLRILFLFESII